MSFRFLVLWFLSTASAFANVRVVATLPDLAAVAREVGGDAVTVTAMVLPNQDPHFADAKPSLVLEVSKADLLLLAGLDLEIGWLPTLLTGSRNPRIQKGSPGYVDCSQFVRVLEVPTGSIDRSMGDVHPGGNPHYFYDPRSMVKVARGVAERLGAIDSANAAAYAHRAEAFAQRVEEARKRWETELSSLQGAPLVGYHRSWVYLEDWLGFDMIADVEPKPGIPPTPSHIARVVELCKQKGVRLVLIESFYPDTTVKLVAQSAGAKVVKLPGGTDFQNGQDYVAHIQNWVDLIKGATGGAAG